MFSLWKNARRSFLMLAILNGLHYSTIKFEPKLRGSFMNAMDVAEYFINRSYEDDSGEVMTHLKLQKLVYYAQGFHLAVFGTVLFEEAVVAWQHGPVVPQLWEKFKQYGSTPIPKPIGDSTRLFSEQQQELLEEVYEVYGQFSAWKLRNLTHNEAPWKSVNINDVITPESMEEYFKTQLA
jgi:uncharacterized phage-associated protein